jgi:hypothetical protein
LPERPADQLIPAAEDEGGMLFAFDLVDPESRFCRHTFLFRVYYHSDEATLLIASGIYRREIGA